MSEFEHDPNLDAIVRAQVVETGAAPGGVVALATRGKTGFVGAIGCAGKLSRHASAAGVTTETPYDLASVTKPLVAATAARLVRSGSLALDAPLGRLLGEAKGTVSEMVPLELFLAHRAGLEAHQKLYAVLEARRPFERARALRTAARARRAECTAPMPSHGFAPVYSDLGFLLVGAALERGSPLALDELFEREVRAPLGLALGSARQWLRRDRSFVGRVAATETIGWRGGELCGVVHDENAWMLAGHGSAGHAGLFGTASAVARFGMALLDALSGADATWLDATTLAAFVRERPGGSLRAGFDGRSPGPSVAGQSSGRNTFGHLGFTGTSLWCDPDAGLVTVLLTNRVCPTRQDLRLRAARSGVQDALYALAARR